MQVVAGPSLFESVHARIRDAICDGVLKPNERLNQDQIAERLNVSRQPVNQALLLLKAQGFVTDVGRRGVRVAPLSLQLVADIYAIRGALDRLAAARAAAAIWSPADIAQGRALLLQLVQGVHGDEGGVHASLQKINVLLRVHGVLHGRATKWPPCR